MHKILWLRNSQILLVFLCLSHQRVFRCKISDSSQIKMNESLFSQELERLFLIHWQWNDSLPCIFTADENWTRNQSFGKKWRKNALLGSWLRITTNNLFYVVSIIKILILYMLPAIPSRSEKAELQKTSVESPCVY